MTDELGRIDELIERSSLGTHGARQLRNRTPAATAQDLLDQPQPSTTQTRKAAAALLNAAHAESAAQTAAELIMPLVQRYCRARLSRHQLLAEQADAIAAAACAEIEQDLISEPDLFDEPQLVNHMYGVASQHVRGVLERAVHIEDEHEQPWSQEREVLAKALEHLDHLEREVIVLRVVVGLSANETAAALGIGPAAVRMVQHAALRALRRDLDL